MFEEFQRLLNNVGEAEVKLFIKPSDGPNMPDNYVDLSNNPQDQVPADPTKPLPLENRLQNMAVRLNNIDLQQQALAQKFTNLEENLNNLAAYTSSSKRASF